MPLDQSLHQTVTCFGCLGFSMYACEFSVPQMRQFCLFTYPPRSKWASSEKILFFCQNRHLLYVAPSAPNSDSFWVRRLFNVCVRGFCASNPTILLVNITAKIKMSLIWKDDFFFAKIGTTIFKVMSQYFPALFKRIHNHIRSAEA